MKSKPNTHSSCPSSLIENAYWAEHASKYMPWMRQLMDATVLLVDTRTIGPSTVGPHVVKCVMYLRAHTTGDLVTVG